MGIDRKLKTTFGSVSNLYDSSRRGYPKKLVNDVISFSKIPKDGKILEIGCGSGKATGMFGKKGYNILALDVSKKLIEIAKEKTLKLPNIDYEIISFEDSNLEPNSFDLVIAAQSWHWINPKIRYQKTHKILKEFGTIAVFWKDQCEEKSDFVKKIMDLYRKHCPKFQDDIESRQQHFRKSIQSTNLFKDTEEKTYEIDLRFSKKRYLKLVQTFSHVIDLDEKNKKNFLLEISNILDLEKEPLNIPYRYTLFTAKKKNM